MTNRYIEDREIRAQRAHIWVRSVRIRSKLSLIELEALFTDSKSDDETARSCLWDKYNKGDVIPRIGVKPGGGLHLASRVEEAYPGTLQWLTSPMWRLIDKAPMSMMEIKETYENLPTLFRSIFIEADYKTKGIFWRRMVNVQKCIETLKKFDDLNAFIALLIMVKEGETTQDQFTHYLALKAAIK